jgi:hypothetical protein
MRIVFSEVPIYRVLTVILKLADGADGIDMEFFAVSPDDMCPFVGREPITRPRDTGFLLLRPSLFSLRHRNQPPDSLSTYKTVPQGTLSIYQ